MCAPSVAERRTRHQAFICGADISSPLGGGGFIGAGFLEPYLQALSPDCTGNRQKAMYLCRAGEQLYIPQRGEMEGYPGPRREHGNPRCVGRRGQRLPIGPTGYRHFICYLVIRSTLSEGDDAGEVESDWATLPPDHAPPANQLSEPGRAAGSLPAGCCGHVGETRSEDLNPGASRVQ